MFCIEVEIKPSKIHGYGVFAKHDIPKGTIIWKRVKKFDRKINKKYYYNLKETQKKIVDHFFPDYKNKIEIFCDYSIFLNHSSEANITNLNENTVISLKDIEAGEELLGNYDELGELLGNHDELYGVN
jgi:SET domain-containing protein